MTTMNKVADSLRKESSERIVRNFVAPYLGAFYIGAVPTIDEGATPPKDYVNKEEFFQRIRAYRRQTFGKVKDDDEATHHSERYEGEVWKHIEIMSARFNRLIRDSAEASAAREDTRAARRQNYHSKTNNIDPKLLEASQSRRKSEVNADALGGFGVPEGCVSFNTLKAISVRGIDGIITSEDQRTALCCMLSDYEERTNDDNITREDFVVGVLEAKSEYPKLGQLDLEGLAFYLFPENDANVTILRDLIDMTRLPPIRSSFITEYTKIRLVKGADMRDLFWYVPFLILYLSIIMSGRGITPRSYMGRGIVLGLNTAIDGYDFPTCSRNTAGVFACDSNSIMTIADITGPDHVYGFMQGSLPNLFWPLSGGTAGETIIANSLRVSGALKIRQQRVRGVSSSSDYNASFFEPLYPAQSERFPAYSIFTINTRDFPPASAYIQSRVLMPWDGSKYGNCDQLNGTGSIAGINKDVECDGYALVIPFNTTKADFTGIVGELLASNWISSDTRNIVVDAILFHLDSVMFVKLQLLFEFQAGGAVAVSRQITPFFFHDSASQPLVLDIAFIFFIVYLVVLLYRFTYKQLFGGILVQLQRWKWVLIDILSFIIFIVSIVLRVTWWALGTPKDPVWQLDHYPNNYEEGAYLFLTLTTLDGFSAIITVIAIFRFTKFVGGLNAVVNTLERSVVDGVVIAFLAGAVLFAFAICATIVWGDRLIGYQTVPTAALSLLLAFIGSFDYRPLHEDEPTFSFFFFAAFVLIAIATLLNMVVAVFSDSFGDEQAVSFNAVNLMSILDNNRHHMLDRWTVKTYFWNLSPVQFILHFVPHYKKKVQKFCKQHCQDEREDLHEEAQQRSWEFDMSTKYSFVSFDANIMGDVLYTLLPSWKNRSSEASVTRRTQSVACLLKLIDEYVELPQYCPEEVQDKDVSTSVYDYARSIFGTFDYSLVMALLVVVPQAKFGASGIASLLEAAQAQTRWYAQVCQMAVRADDSVVVSLRLAAVKARIRIRREKRRKERAEKSELNTDYTPPCLASSLLRRPTIASPPGDELFNKFCSSLDYLTRRVLLGILASAGKKRFKDNLPLNRVTFVEIAESIPDFPKEDYPPTELYDRMGVERWLEDRGKESDAFTMVDTMPAFQEEFAVQCLGFHFTNQDVKDFEMAIIERLMNKPTSVGDVEKHSAAGTEGGFNKNTQDNDGDEEEMKAGAEAAEDSNPDELAEANEAPAQYKVTRREFSKIWEIAFGIEPPGVTLDRVESLFPNNIVDLRLFLHNCRMDPFSHQRRSFQSEFSSQMSRVSTFLRWSAFYVPFLVFIIAVAMIKNSSADNIHVSVGLRESLAPEEEVSSYTLDQVNTYLAETVSNVWSGLPNETAQPHNLVNYFIGAMRVRQVRARSRKSSKCSRVFNEFFGDTTTRVLDFPSSYSSDERTFYTTRVQRDFSSLITNNDCYFAYDTGIDIEEQPMTIPTFVTTPSVLAAFSHREARGIVVAAHDATYVPSGYYLDLPYTLNTSSAQAQIAELITNTSWLDKQTRLVVVEFAIFNNNLRLYSHARFGFEITSGGAMYPIRRIVAVEKPRGTDTKEFYILAILTLVFLLLYCVLFLSELIFKVRDKVKRVKVHIVQSFITTVFASPIIIMDFTIIALVFGSWVWSTAKLLSMDVKSLSNDDSYPVEVERVVSFASTNKVLEGSVIILASLRFLNILSLNHRVNLLFETFRRATKDLIAILVLFVISLLAFTLGGMLLFGYLYNDQFNIQNSFFDFFNTVSGGDSTYPDLVQLRRQVSVIFFIIFFVVCSYVLYNMVIAVLTGAFSEVKANLYDPSEANEVLAQSLDDGEDLEELVGRQTMTYRQRVWDSLKKFIRLAGNTIRRNIVLREIYQVITWCKSKSTKSTLSNRCRVGRSLWTNLADWWSALDSSLPSQACLAGLNLLILEREVLAEKEAGSSLLSGNSDGRKPVWFTQVDEEYDDNVSAHSARTTNTAATNNNTTKYQRDTSAIHSEADEIKVPPRFRSYGERRRLPLWQEFLYSKFRNDFQLIQHHIVEIPAYLLAQREESIWLQVLSAEHYFGLEEELYSVECDGPSPSYIYDPESLRNAEDEDSDSDRDDMAWLATIAGFAQDTNRRTSLQISGSTAPIISRSTDALSISNSPFSPTGPTITSNDATVGVVGPHRASATSIRRPSISRKAGSTPAPAVYVDDYSPREDDEVHPHQPRKSVTGSPKDKNLDNEDEVVADNNTPRSLGTRGRGDVVQNSATAVYDFDKSSVFSTTAGDKLLSPRDFPEGGGGDSIQARNETTVFVAPDDEANKAK